MPNILPAILLAAFVALGHAAGPTATEAQKSALKSDCRMDFVKLCTGVSPGGAPAFKCLEQHRSDLSKSCEAAVDAVYPAGAAEPAN